MRALQRVCMGLCVCVCACPSTKFLCICHLSVCSARLWPPYDVCPFVWWRCGGAPPYCVHLFLYCHLGGSTTRSSGYHTHFTMFHFYHCIPWWFCIEILCLKYCKIDLDNLTSMNKYCQQNIKQAQAEMHYSGKICCQAKPKLQHPTQLVWNIPPPILEGLLCVNITLLVPYMLTFI